MARQLWDVKTDCMALWNDFFARRYGPAAEVMRQFYESLEQMYNNVEPLKGWSSNLASRLHMGAKELFVEPHLRYRASPASLVTRPRWSKWSSTARHAASCSIGHSQCGSPNASEPVLSRTSGCSPMESARWPITTLACKHSNSGGRPSEEARRQFAEAKRLAELLRHDTWSPGLSFVHDEPFPLDAFHATYASGALDHLTELLGPEEPASGK